MFIRIYIFILLKLQVGDSLKYITAKDYRVKKMLLFSVSKEEVENNSINKRYRKIPAKLLITASSSSDSEQKKQLRALKVFEK